VAFPDFFKEFKRGVNLILVSTSKRGIGFIKIFAINSIITFLIQICKNEAPSNQVLSDFFFPQTGISIVVLFHPPFDFSKKKQAAPLLEKHFSIPPSIFIPDRRGL
jgi:hypothetical protein